MTKPKRTETSSFGVTHRENHDASKFYGSRLYEGFENTQVISKTENSLSAQFIDQIICSSAESMSELPANSIHLMITSPPYNVSKAYDEDLSLAEYLDLIKKVFSETYRVLVNGGRACVNVANLGRKPYIPLSDYISKIMIEIGYHMRGEIVWNKAASAGSSTAWGSWQSASNPILRDVHEYILIFSKGDYKRTLRPEEPKKNTISRTNFMAWTKSIWTMGTESAKKVGHPAPFPVELPKRLIELYSFTNDLILDPFMGSGTTAVAALGLERHFVGYEIKPDYIKLAEQRLAVYTNQIRFA